MNLDSVPAIALSLDMAIGENDAGKSAPEL